MGNLRATFTPNLLKENDQFTTNAPPMTKEWRNRMTK